MKTPANQVILAAGLVAALAVGLALAQRGGRGQEEKAMEERETGRQDRELRKRLTPEQYRVTQEKGTERPFSGKYWNEKRAGEYVCIVCGHGLFSSESKYKSGSGWPSFWQPAGSNSVREVADRSHGMVRTEVVCSQCGAHLGHVFEDGPQPTGLRYCINSASLKLEPEDR